MQAAAPLPCQPTLLPLDHGFPRFTLAHVLPDRLPQSQTEWAQLLESQQKYHDSELQKWREIIKSSVMLLDQVRPHGPLVLCVEGHCVLPATQPPAHSPYLDPLQPVRCISSTPVSL